MALLTTLCVCEHVRSETLLCAVGLSSADWPGARLGTCWQGCPNREPAFLWEPGRRKEPFSAIGREGGGHRWESQLVSDCVTAEAEQSERIF